MAAVRPAALPRTGHRGEIGEPWSDQQRLPQYSGVLEPFWWSGRRVDVIGRGKLRGPALNISQQKFELVVIDEAARCDPGELAVGAQSGHRVLLVGDHKQLPPLYDLKLVEEVATRLRKEDADVWDGTGRSGRVRDNPTGAPVTGYQPGRGIVLNLISGMHLPCNGRCFTGVLAPPQFLLSFQGWRTR
jgi:hypothetical protein